MGDVASCGSRVEEGEVGFALVPATFSEEAEGTDVEDVCIDGDVAREGVCAG